MHAADHPGGTGLLDFARDGPRTVVRRAYARSPLKLLNPRNHGTAAWVYLASYGGGLVGGDAVRLGIEVGPGASALLSTQASTKIYRSPLGASQQLAARVSDGALLVVAPDPLVCFAGSTYRQDQRYELAPGAGLVLVDGLVSGRVRSRLPVAHAAPAGERWAFDKYCSRTTIRVAGRLVIHESLALDAADGDIGARMGRFNTLVFCALVGSPVRDAARALAARVAAMAVEARSDLVVSAAPVGGDVLVLRLAGVSVEAVGQAVRHYLGFVRGLLGDDPWARRW
jgi:urease accessory protein